MSLKQKNDSTEPSPDPPTSWIKVAKALGAAVLPIGAVAANFSLAVNKVRCTQYIYTYMIYFHQQANSRPNAISATNHNLTKRLSEHITETKLSGILFQLIFSRCCPCRTMSSSTSPHSPCLDASSARTLPVSRTCSRLSQAIFCKHSTCKQT